MLLKAGMSARRAVCYNLLSSLLCLLGMVVGVAAGHTPEATQWIFAAAAGMFLYIALVDMVRESINQSSARLYSRPCSLPSRFIIVIIIQDRDPLNSTDTDHLNVCDI